MSPSLFVLEAIAIGSCKREHGWGERKPKEAGQDKGSGVTRWGSTEDPSSNVDSTRGPRNSTMEVTTLLFTRKCGVTNELADEVTYFKMVR
jgi:hypothetical protein